MVVDSLTRMDYRSDMTNAENENAEARRLVELLASTHYAMATTFDVRFSFYQAEPYACTRAALKAAIALAYPAADVDAVEETWVDCGESIAYCVDYLARMAAAELAERQAEQVASDEPVTVAPAGPSGYALPSRPAAAEIAVADWLIARNIATPGLSYQEAAAEIMAAAERVGIAGPVAAAAAHAVDPSWRTAFNGEVPDGVTR